MKYEKCNTEWRSLVIMEWIPETLYLKRFVIAMALGALVGIEREFSGKPAGLRTQMLVSGSAALFMILGFTILEAYTDDMGHGVRMDPSRIIQAIVAGVSFLGAGTIFRSRQGNQVEGLTTAASILMSAAVGIACGLGKIGLAAAVSVMVLLALRGLAVVEYFMSMKPKQKDNKKP